MSTAKIGLMFEGSQIVIEVPAESVTHISGMIDNLVRPMLAAAGFAEGTINEAIGEFGALA